MSKKILKGAVALGIGLAFVLGAAGTASATVAYPVEGGTWTYGVYSGGEWGSQGTVRSDYYHPTKTHKSTACAPGSCVNSSWVGSGGTSLARKYPANYSGGNTAYYDVL